MYDVGAAHRLWDTGPCWCTMKNWETILDMIYENEYELKSLPVFRMLLFIEKQTTTTPVFIVK